MLIPSTQEGKEIAGRLAVRLDNGVLTDVVSLDADGIGHPAALRRLDHRQVQGLPRHPAGERAAVVGDARPRRRPRRWWRRLEVTLGRLRQARPR